MLDRFRRPTTPPEPAAQTAAEPKPAAAEPSWLFDGATTLADIRRTIDAWFERLSSNKRSGWLWHDDLQPLRDVARPALAQRARLLEHDHDLQLVELADLTRTRTRGGTLMIGTWSLVSAGRLYEIPSLHKTIGRLLGVQPYQNDWQTEVSSPYLQALQDNRTVRWAQVVGLKPELVAKLVGCSQKEITVLVPALFDFLIEQRVNFMVDTLWERVREHNERSGREADAKWEVHENTLSVGRQAQFARAVEQLTRIS